MALYREPLAGRLMGGLAGIVHWDARPIVAAELESMIRASAHRGSDGVHTRLGARVALAHLLFITTPAQAADHPIADAHRGLFFVFDGRLDNREELAAVLEIRDRDVSDARLAFEAFARWETDTASHLLGDFAFVGWDDRRRRLVCARDHMGIRHLHYCATDDRVICATDLAQVLAHPAVRKLPDPSIAADYLAIDVRNGPETLYSGVRRVPAGHTLIGENGRVRLQQYWSAEPRGLVRYARDEEYAEHCRELLTRSVAARMRSDRPIAAMLSGGLDSSSVFSVAHRLVNDPGPPPRAFSMVYPDRPESDERPFIDAVARHCGTIPVEVRPGPITARDLQHQAERSSGTPAMPADAMANTLYAAMRDHGHRVTLTGAGGDFLFTGSVFQYADLLREFRVVGAVRRFIDDWYAGETGRSALGLLQAGVWPLLPLPMKNVLRPLARYAVDVEDQPPWLLVERRPAEIFPDAPRGGSYATEDVTRQVGCGMHFFFVECAERAAIQAGIELRHPLLDARVVEFALGIPDDQRKRGRYTKYVLREALGADLVESVRLRRTKGDFAHAIVEAIEALGGEPFFAGMQIAKAGWVDPAIVSAKYRRMRSQIPRGPEAYGEHVPALWMISAVELWYRSAFGPATGGVPGRSAPVSAPASRI